MARRTRRKVVRQWNQWLEGLKPDQIEHVLLSLTDERQALNDMNDTLRRMRADPSINSGQAPSITLRPSIKTQDRSGPFDYRSGGQAPSTSFDADRALVNLKIRKARRRLAQLTDRR